MDTGLIIKKIRVSESLTQDELATELDVTRAYLSQVENGRKHCSLDLLRKVAQRFDIPIALLLAWEDDASVDAELNGRLQRLFMEILSARIAKTQSPRPTG
ncbi:MAG: hypothetical protein AMXMBFR84_15670 [Candidatus Hydrogenedentota bacterium]